MDVELVADVGAVGLDGARANRECTGNLFVRFVFGEERKHSSLGWCEGGNARLFGGERSGASRSVDEVCGKRGARVVLSGSDGANAGYDVSDGALLQHVAAYAEVERLVKEIFLAEGGEKNELDRKRALAYGPGDAEAVDLRHLDVEDGYR